MIKLSPLNILKVFILFLIMMIFNSCQNSTHVKNITSIGYDFNKPDKTIYLPAALKEISGITIIDSSKAACIQDENGIIFIFNLIKNEITDQIYFGPKGDYEGICVAHDIIYVLRSDAVLFRIPGYKTSAFSEKIDLPEIIEEDNEGLCYDTDGGRLLIAPKSKPGKESLYKGRHVIYGYDLLSQSLLKEPVLTIDLSAISCDLSVDRSIMQKKSKKKIRKSKSEISFKPSEIGIHPITKKLYLLTGEDLKLFIFDTAGTLEYVENLDPNLFNMPEGLTFFPNGDLLISNESGYRNATILRFNYKQK